MNPLFKRLLLGGLLPVSPLALQAQSAFVEGRITYTADTVRRLDPQPAAYIAHQLVVYRKAGATRLEVWLVNRFNPADTKKEVHVRNGTGTYTWIDYSDSTRAAAGNSALFVSYEQEQALPRAAGPSPQKRTRRPAKVLQQLPWLGLPAERIALTPDGNRATEAVVTQAVDWPLWAIFPDVLALPGTPLQFSERGRGWLTRFTAKALTAQAVSDALFRVDPRLKVMSLAEARESISAFD